MDILEHPAMKIGGRLLAKWVVFSFIVLPVVIGGVIYSRSTHAAEKPKKQPDKPIVVDFTPKACTGKGKETENCRRMLEYRKNIEDSKKHSTATN